MNAPGTAIEAAIPDDIFDFETFFHVHYDRIARAIVRVVRDPARAEEIAVGTFWKFLRLFRLRDEPVLFLEFSPGSLRICQECEHRLAGALGCVDFKPCDGALAIPTGIHWRDLARISHAE